MENIKILGLLNKIMGGSEYHRVKLPLDGLNGKIIKVNNEDKIIEINYLNDNELNEDHFKDNDIIYIHWSVKNPIAWLTEMSDKYNTKIVHSVDDYWLLPSKHIQKKTSNYSHIPIISSISDLLIVSTNRLAKHLVNINDTITISYNDLPVGTSQFIPVELTKKEDKIAIGICGSPSHLHDYQSIKWNIGKIVKDKELKEKCKFVICGYMPNNKIWDKILKIFTHEGFEVEVYTYADPEHYMMLYKNIDILLAPLSPSEFAECKSGLKILEASVNGIPVIASKEYEKKEFNNCLIVRKSADYYNLVKQLVKDDQYLEVGKMLSKNNLELNNFEGRIENLRKAIEYTLNKKDNKPENLKLFSITYDNEQYAEYEQYDNSSIKTVEQKSYLFEYNPILDIVNNKLDNSKETDYVGILSHKYSKKMGIPKRLMYKLFKELTADNNTDFINLSRFKVDGSYLIWTEMQHPGFLEMFTYLCDKLGLKIIDPKHNIHSNFFITKKSIYVDYVNNILKPAIDLLENNEYLKERVWKDSKYKGLEPEKLKEVSGLDFYTFHTFVLERLMSVYLENHKEIKVKSI